MRTDPIGTYWHDAIPEEGHPGCVSDIVMTSIVSNILEQIPPGIFGCLSTTCGNATMKRRIASSGPFSVAVAIVIAMVIAMVPMI
eukprot:scaffold36167_cov51-Attheya_sp.AAC.3